MAKRNGTEWVGDSEVDCYEPARGQSVESAARELGFRVLSRREQSDAVVAVIADGGLHFRCVRL